MMDILPKNTIKQLILNNLKITKKITIIHFVASLPRYRCATDHNRDEIVGAHQCTGLPQNALTALAGCERTVSRYLSYICQRPTMNARF